MREGRGDFSSGAFIGEDLQNSPGEVGKKSVANVI